jgi:hypothetical protein
MFSAAALLNESDAVEAGPRPTRGDIVARYRHLRAITKEHHSKVLDFVSSSAMLQQARRLGMSDGRQLFLDSPEEFDLLSDLLVYTAPAGRSRALDRYARNLPPPSGSDEALTLDAMRNARFAFLKMQRRHPSAGLILRDDARNRDVWLVDLGFETWMQEGMGVATRYFTPGPFSMAAAVSIPLRRALIAETVDSVLQLLRKKTAELFDDPRFAEALYRTAIARGALERVRYVDPPAEGCAAA